MVNQSIYNVLTGSRIWNSCDNSTDCCVGRNIQSSFKNLVRNSFNIGYNEEIVSIRDTTFWGNYNEGAVVTDCGVRCIPDNNDSSNFVSAAWSDVEYVTYKDCILYFWGYGDKNENNCASFHINFFVKDSEKWDSVGRELQNVFSRAAALVQPQQSALDTEFSAMKEYYGKDSYDSSIQCANNIIGMTDDEDYIFQANLYKAHSFKFKALSIDFSNIANDEEYDRKESELLSYLNDSFTCFANLLYKADSKDWVFNEEANLNKILALRRVNYGRAAGGSAISARQLSIGALNTQDADIRKEAMERYDDLTGYLFDQGFDLFALSDEDLQTTISQNFGSADIETCREIAEEEKFTNAIPFSDRQFIVLAKDKNQIGGYYDINDNIKWVFTLNRYPQDLRFEGYPEANVLYMAHPVRKGLYIQFEGAEEKLFMDKIREFCYLVQCLGATEVTFKSLKGRQVSGTSDANSSIHGEFDMMITDGQGTMTNQNKSEGQYNSSRNVGLKQVFNPQKYPYCPDDLAWYNTDSTWKMLVKQRLEGNMLNYHYRISSSETCQMSNSRFDEIKGSFDYMMVSGNANYNSKTDTTFNMHEETEWEISVVFKPKDELGENGNSTPIVSTASSLSPAEQEYLDEYKEIIADGEISDRDSRFLEKIKKANGISDQRARELEGMVTPSLTAEEQEYFNEYKEIISEGEISLRDQRFLDKLKKSNGISESRAKEIEAMAN